MSSPPATRALKFTAIYLRLLLRHFGITPELRQGILQGTGVSEEALEESAQLVTLDQQLRQQDNLRRLFGEGWAISAPDLWSHSAFGLLSVASGSAPNLNEAFMTIIAQSDIIGTIWWHSLEDNNNNAYFYYDLDITMQEKHCRIAPEVGFIGLKSLLQMYLTRHPDELRFKFSCSPQATPHA